MYSQSPQARYLRQRRLVDDEFDQRCLEENLKSYRRRRLKELATNNTMRATWMRNGFVDRVRHHLSNGRDVGDIAVREGVPVSRVAAAVEQIGGGK